MRDTKESRTIRLGDHCLKIGSGATPRGGKEAYLSEGPFSLIRSQNILNERFSFGGLAFISQTQADQLSNVEVLADDVLLNITGDSVARVCQVDPAVLPARVNQHVAIIRPDKEIIDPRFLRYLLVSPEMQSHMLGLSASGATRNALTKGMIEKFEIPLIPLPEQRAIAATLGALDDKIELNRRMNATLEAMARALFRDWFVDFGPTRTKMAGEAPDLSPDLLSLFPDRLDDAGKPVGWDNVPMDALAEVTMGISPEGSTYNDTGVGTPLCNGPVEYGDFFLRQIKWTTAPSKLARRGDLIICVRGSTTGRHAFADAEYCLGRGVASIRGRESNQEFVETALMLQMDRLLQKTTGSVFPSLATQDIKKFALVDPGQALRMAFATIVRPMRDRIWSNAEESQTLAQTRDLLLPRLMSGELRVADLDQAEKETAA
ncbi:restriction endonuclease subunit S [Pseudorhodobacter wandonensis]|uniref:restriction endonuclease subunit S n=1 Tax=Pseudorhodobacter wandonensis TaxID=1120568 RepID=UPI0009E2281D|nr:restriction endonuclease subunit S [Pseudorhodobacter wandonensis]